MPRCRQCGVFGRLTETACAKCGAALPKRGSIEDRLSARDARLAERMAGMDRVFGDEAGTPSTASAENKTVGAADGGEVMPLIRELRQFIFSGPYQPRQAHGLVVKSSYINSNRIYAQRAQASTIHVDVEEFSVNAFATESTVT